MPLSTIKQDVVFPVSGDAIFTKYNADGTLDFSDPAKNYTTKNQVVESFTFGVTVNTNDLASGNSNYPRAKYPTTVDGSFSMKINSYDAELFAFVTASDFTKAKSNVMFPDVVRYEVPAASPYTIALPDTAVINTVTVRDNYNNPYTIAESTPAEGTYTIAAVEDVTTLTFAAADAGRVLFIGFSIPLSNVMAMEMRKQISLPAIHVQTFGTAHDVDTTQELRSVAVLDKISVSGEIKPPDLTNNPTGGWTVPMSFLEPRDGHPPFAQYFAPKTA